VVLAVVFFLPLGLVGLAGPAFAWTGVLAVAASLRIGKRVPIAGAFARIVPLGFFTASVVVHAVRIGVQPLSAGDFVPTRAGFAALVPVLVVPVDAGAPPPDARCRTRCAWLATVLPAGLVTFAGERTACTLSQVVPLLVVIGLGFPCYALGVPTRALDPKLTSTSA
jgi:hypothetical protein